MHIWKPGMKITKDCQMMQKERIPGTKEITRMVTIENGLPVDKPEDVDIIGINTPEGFEVCGMAIKRKYS